ncbi:CvpA family protein [Anaeromicrobium sediminis]|uniref:Colicin V production protein n=1 Tax=Anaeromicrobium sediminis TaxID=1478221 RepID=A0A267MFZ1_9FIRM|nr:CvpA family protein [Anaeromicrobium sediminis]PAB58466.1 hypothetical protein CCE28_15275 [Anaeromicrobium sediminis]
MSLVDSCVLIVCALSTLMGYLSGLIKSFFSIASYFIAGYVAKLYYKSVAVYIVENTSIGESINNLVSNSIATSAVPVMGNALTNNVIFTTMTLSIVNIISIILVFIIVKIILSIASTLLNGVASLPILNGLNRLGGGAFGFVRGILIIFIVFAVIVPFNLNKNGKIEDEINKSKFGKILYINNPIIKIVEGDFYESGN